MPGAEPLSLLERVIRELNRVVIVGSALSTAQCDTALRVAYMLPDTTDMTTLTTETLAIIHVGGVVVADWQDRLRAPL